MIRRSSKTASLRFGLVLLSAGSALILPAARAQSTGKGYFIPHPKAAPVQHVVQRPMPPAAQPGVPPGTQAVPQQKLPPIPQLPALPPEQSPPTTISGVLSAHEVMQLSTAAQGVEKIINARRQKLATEAQADQRKWEAEQKTILGEKAKLSKPVLAAREHTLRKEIEQAQVEFHNRNLAIEVSARTALGKIEATLIAVIRQVAQAHGMNLVLHRSQVVLAQPGFDISKEIATRLNKILPSVAVPPSVVPKIAGGHPAPAHAAPAKKK